MVLDIEGTYWNPILMKLLSLSFVWKHIVLANYRIDPKVLEPHLPRHTFLDLYEGACLVSIVGFLFLWKKGTEDHSRQFGVFYCWTLLRLQQMVRQPDAGTPTGPSGLEIPGVIVLQGGLSVWGFLYEGICAFPLWGTPLCSVRKRIGSRHDAVADIINDYCQTSLTFILPQGAQRFSKGSQWATLFASVAVLCIIDGKLLFRAAWNGFWLNMRHGAVQKT